VVLRKVYHDVHVFREVYHDDHVFREGYHDDHVFHKMHHYVLVLRHVRNILKFYLQMHVPGEYDMKSCHIIYRIIYLLTAVGLTPRGSSTVHIYTQTIHRTTQ